MTDIVTPPAIEEMPPAPLPTDTPDVFSSKAFATVAAQASMVDQMNASASATEQNATAAQERATAASASASSATTSASNAAGSASDALSFRNTAQAAAAAAQASAGLPALTTIGDVLTVKGTGGTPDGVAYQSIASNPAVAAKADKDGAVVTRMSTNRIPYTPAAGATQALDVSLAGEFQVTAAGTLTLTFTNVPAGNVSFVLTLDCINFGGKTINWPAGNWIKADGSFTSAVGNSGVTWQTTGTDIVLVWFKNGTPHYKVLR